MSLNFIYESTSILQNSELQILETTTVNGKKNPKIAFKARLQTAEEQNQNMRYYPKLICQEIVSTLNPKAQSRSLLQEVDHPLVDPSDPNAKRRAIIVEIKNCGSLVRNIKMDGNHIIAEIETLSGFLGPDLANVILNDKADLGFSLRMFGKVVNENGVNRVSTPIRPVTYDIVSNPSHKSAKVLEFLPENINTFFPDENSYDSSLLTENTDNIVFPDSNREMYEFLSSIIEESFRSMHTINFKF